MKRVLLAALVASAGAISGCSTPQPVRDQAIHTGALIAQFQSEMREFERVQLNAGKARLRSIAAQERDIEAAAEKGRLSDAVRSAIGDSTGSRVKSTLMPIVQSIGTEAGNSVSSAAATEKELAALMKPLPSSSAKMSAAENLVADMGQDLSTATRLDEARAFFKTVKDAVDENRQKIKDANDSASASEK